MSGPTARKILESLPRAESKWWVDIERSTYLARANRKEFFAVRTLGGLSYPAAELGFIAREPDTFRVVNVVPVEQGQLTRTQYNRILLDFYDVHVRPREAPGFCPAPPRGERDISEYLDEKGIDLLAVFSDAANKSTGNTHPLDFERWAQFVSHSFRGNQILPGHILLAALVAQQWQADEAIELVGQYETFIALLKVFAES
jgi:hypothetical protein